MCFPPWQIRIFVAGLGEAGHGNNSPGPTGAGYNESGNAVARRGEPGIYEANSRRLSAPGYNKSKIRVICVIRCWFSYLSRVS